MKSRFVLVSAAFLYIAGITSTSTDICQCHAEQKQNGKAKRKQQAKAPSPTSEESQAKAVALIDALGGKVKVDVKQKNRPVIAVDLLGCKVNDDHMKLIGKLAKLQSIRLGLKISFRLSRNGVIPGAVYVTDDGIRSLSGLSTK